MPRQEYKVNEYITLKLEGEKTFIYIQGKKFLQCLRLVLNIQEEKLHEYDGINSNDKDSNFCKNHLGQISVVQEAMAIPVRNQKHNITPEQEFWRHCSNLQVWVENEYDTRLLHPNISFPLLRKLVDVGDLTARRIFYDEIIKSFISGYKSTRIFLAVQGYLNYLTKQELQLLAQKTDDFENWICNQIFTEYYNLLDITSAEELKDQLYYDNDLYFDLLANLADLEYTLCKKKLVETILSIADQIDLKVLITTVKRNLRHFTNRDINHLIQTIVARFERYPPRDFEIDTFQIFLKSPKIKGIEMQLSHLAKKYRLR